MTKEWSKYISQFNWRHAINPRASHAFYVHNFIIKK